MVWKSCFLEKTLIRHVSLKGEKTRQDKLVFNYFEDYHLGEGISLFCNIPEGRKFSHPASDLHSVTVCFMQHNINTAEQGKGMGEAN